MRKRVNERSDVSLNEASLKEKLTKLSRQRWTEEGHTVGGEQTGRETDCGNRSDRERKGQTAGRGQAGCNRQQVEGRKTLSHSNKHLSRG